MSDVSQMSEDFQDFEWEDVFCAEDPRSEQVEVLEKWAEALGSSHGLRGSLSDLTRRVNALTGPEAERLQAYVYLLTGTD